MTVVALKLTSSEEVVGEVVESVEGSHYIVKNPVVVAIQQGPDGRAALGFLPFMPYTSKEGGFKFHTNHVILVKEVDDQMKNQYNSVFGGIVVPPKQLITG